SRTRPSMLARATSARSGVPYRAIIVSCPAARSQCPSWTSISSHRNRSGAARFRSALMGAPDQRPECHAASVAVTPVRPFEPIRSALPARGRGPSDLDPLDHLAAEVEAGRDQVAAETAAVVDRQGEGTAGHAAMGVVVAAHDQ